MIVADKQCWRAELTIGTRYGYTGPEAVKPADLIPHIEEYQKRLDPWFAVIVWTRGTVIGPTFPSETVVKVALESNPLYTADATEEQITAYAAHLADYLAVEFQQVRVYVAVYPIRSLIIDTTVQPMTRTDDIARRMLDASHRTITPTPHTFSAAGERAVIVASNGRVLGWVAMTSGAGTAIGELWANAADDIGYLLVEAAEARAERDHNRRVAALHLAERDALAAQMAAMRAVVSAADHAYRVLSADEWFALDTRALSTFGKAGTVMDAMERLAVALSAVAALRAIESEG